MEGHTVIIQEWDLEMDLTELFYQQKISNLQVFQLYIHK